MNVYKSMLDDKNISVWPIITSDERWSLCTEGPCSCVDETRTLSCRRIELVATIPRKQKVPYDTTHL